MRTIAALRQAVFAALTSPALSYTVNNGAPQPLAAGNVRPGGQFVGAGVAPDPFVSFEISAGPTISLAIADRRVHIKVAVSSAAAGGDDLVTEILEGVRARLISGPEGISALSRAATGSTLPVTVREIREVGTPLGAAFESVSQRWYASTEFSAIAL